MEARKLFASFSLVVVALCTASGTTMKYYIDEEAPLGTFIGNLSLDLKINASEQQNTVFRFMHEEKSSLILMGEGDGCLTVGARMDRESLCHRSPLCLINFDVVVVSKEKFHLIHVEVQVRDTNDHAPRFPRNEIRLDIAEDVAVGTKFPLEAANDLDVGNNYVQEYHLHQNRHFSIETKRGEDGIAYPELVLVKDLDSDVEDTLKMTASDGGSPPKLGSVTVRVNVLDSNDNSPRFELTPPKVELHEDAPVGYLLLKLYASDPDHGANGEVRYGFMDGVADEIKDTFAIDFFTGAVTLKSPVDYETRKSYELSVQAYDLGVNSVPSTSKVTVEVVDVNDNAPEIHIKPMASASEGVAHITEAAAVESFVALISTTDRDSGTNGDMRVSLSGHEHFKLKQAYGDTFMIVTTAPLDREKIPEYNMTVVAEDLGSPPFITSRRYTIRVSDENDNAPLFSKPVYDISFMESKEPGSYIATLVARDLDDGANGQVTYKLIDNDIDGAPLSSYVAVHPISGSLYTVQSLDYEYLKQIEVGIEASDGGSTPRSSTAIVKVKVVDENDNAPFITHPVLINGSADVPLSHNAPAGYVAVTVSAHDLDDGVNGKLSFSLLEDNERTFFINKTTGVIALKHSLSHKQGDSLEIKVMVTDGGRTPFSCTATLRFVVTDEELFDEHLVVSFEMTDVDKSEEQKTNLEASFIIIILLGAGCAFLLVAIIAVAFSSRPGQRETYFRKNNGLESAFVRSPVSANSTDSSDSGSCHESGATVSEQLTSTRDDSSYEEQSQDSDSKLFRPLLKRTNLDSVAMWHDDRQSHHIRIPPIDQTSMKDSGKGDSDIPDSDSNISSDADQRISISGHRRAMNSVYSAPMVGMCQATKEISTTRSSNVASSGYKIAYRSSMCNYHSVNQRVSTWRNYDYIPSALPRAPEQFQDPACHRIGTLYHHNPYSYMGRAPQVTSEVTPSATAF
ncbi:protocadherin-8-like isoform X2 [Triplophysa rosa]|uniref:Protocadherin-8-like n=1 Tax=Triplophysa rosa TaxID=992332 RepID=A0A9W7TJA1_TRIRA|nr:protocadherin-8-like isoform X2 [Triplophysa rosa]KAI7797451.1 putative protocadherin-8-like [Triplophysa rosa]